MGKYIKSTSVFTLRKKIQDLEGGAKIFERDWTTLGETLRFGKGKIPLYNDGNFIFTRASIQPPSKRSKSSSETVELHYNDVKDAKSEVNNVELNTNSNDIRSFAYYGSCAELVDKSISNIIMTFPACIAVTGKIVSYPKYDSDNVIIEYNTFKKDGKQLYVVDNAFNIDILSKSINLTENDNQYRYMCETYEEFELVRYETVDSEFNEGYKVLKRDDNGKLISSEPSKIVGYSVEYTFDRCTQNDQWYNYVEGKKPPILVTFKSEDGTIVEFVGFRNDTDFLFMSTDAGVVIRPNNTVVEDYFNSLKGFERQLLNRNSKPLYSNTFKTIIEVKDKYVFADRLYTFPSLYDYCIDISSGAFSSFYSNLIEMASMYDELWTDNLYNKMTHETIQNFDWTYTKDFVDGDEEENIEGGEQMKKTIHLLGRIFDEGKQYIDGIANNNNVSTDNYCNIPDALVSDTLELHGWDVVSVVPLLKNDNENKGVVYIDEEFLKNGDVELKWFDNTNVETSNSSNYDVKFMKRMILSSKRIFQSKGTQEAIDMIMGMFGFGRKFNIGHKDNDNGDYSITEYWYEAEPLEYDKEIDVEGTKIKLGSLIALRNSNRGDYFECGEEYVNLALQTVLEKGTRYVIPYFDKKETYGDVNYDFYFQSDGGWGHMLEETNSDNDFQEYIETVSYLNVVTRTNDLLQIRTVDVNKGDIYYVVDLSDVPEVFGNNNLDKYSHFFYVKEDGSTSYPETWGYVDMTATSGEMFELRKKAEYLNDIINTSFGNNPHVGFGNYDDGRKFYEYLKEPLKAFVDRGEIYYSNENEKQELTFKGMDKGDELSEKYKYNKEYSDSKNTDVFYEGDYSEERDKEEGKLKKDYKREECKRKLFNFIKKEEQEKFRININCKVMCMENLLKSEEESDDDENGMVLFKKYFKKCMLPYIMQVIPSTTILLLKNF